MREENWASLSLLVAVLYKAKLCIEGIKARPKGRGMARVCQGGARPRKAAVCQTRAP